MNPSPAFNSDTATRTIGQAQASPPPQGRRAIGAWWSYALISLALCAATYVLGTKVLQPLLAAEAPTPTIQVPDDAPQAADPALGSMLTGVQAAILLNGRPVAAPDQRIALPAGARFQLALHATTSGTVRIEAINAKGAITPLWERQLRAGQKVNSPWLRLAGLRGMETLRVISADGQVQTFSILHV